ncbi:MAG: penicillin-binding transpeptidase domain-containing protein, partial [Candidatus Bipolaricaulota bacterium]
INTGMIRVAQRLGEERLYHSLISFGFGQQTGIALPGEEVGILRDVEEWSKLALAATSIGQSVAVTGIQLARATAAIANGGLLLEPQIIKQIGESEKDDSVLVHRIGTAESCTIMTGLLQQAVETGTGTPAAVSGFAVAGKTGTAQKATPGQGYAAGKYTSLFVGYFPAQKPQYLALVVLDEVKTLPVWGGYTAGQIFHDITSRMVNAEHLSPVAAY